MRSAVLATAAAAVVVAWLACLAAAAVRAWREPTGFDDAYFFCRYRATELPDRATELPDRAIELPDRARG
jgi:hypothetical protein